MIMPIIKISYKCVCGGIGQGREETKVSDRCTSKDLSSCSSEPEGGKEGKSGLADNWLDILFLTSCLQSPKWFECCLAGRCLLPLMFLQHSQTLQVFVPPRAEVDDICLFSEGLEWVWLLLWAVPHQCCGPGDPVSCPESHHFPLVFAAWESHEQDFIGQRKGWWIYTAGIYTAFTTKSALSSCSACCVGPKSMALCLRTAEFGEIFLFWMWGEVGCWEAATQHCHNSWAPAQKEQGLSLKNPKQITKMGTWSLKRKGDCIP